MARRVRARDTPQVWRGDGGEDRGFAIKTDPERRPGPLADDTPGRSRPSMMLSLFSTFAVGLGLFICFPTILVPFIRGLGDKRRDIL